METSGMIQKRSLAEEVADRIGKQIADGKFADGEKLPTEPELMKFFGVGRSTIRESIRILENMGMVNVQQGRGTFVTRNGESNEPFSQRLKRADIKELREVRDILETPVARMAAERRTEADINAMKQYITERREAAESGNVSRCIKADINFHNSIAQATHNAILADLYQAMTTYLSKGYEYIYKDTFHLLETQSIHEEILKDIKSGDVEAAMRTAKLFWKDAEDTDYDK